MITGARTAGSFGSGNFVANGGTLRLDSVLNDGAPSHSDVLVVDRTSIGAAGPTQIVVRNAGGGGGLTSGNGILVVDTPTGGSTQPGTFSLAGPVIAGPYEYSLFRSGIDGSNPQAWYLRSTLPAPPEGRHRRVQPRPARHPRHRRRRDRRSPTSARRSRCLRPCRPWRPSTERASSTPCMSASARRSNCAAAADLSSGLRQRRLGPHPCAITASATATAFSAAGRPSTTTSLPSRRVSTSIVSEHEDGSRDHGGVYFAIGHGDGDVEHSLPNLRVRGGSNEFDGYTIGGYWTHFGPSGWYLDGVLQGTWYDFTTKPRRFLETDTEGFGLAASLETGYPFHLGSGVVLEPQAQLIYQTLNISHAQDIASVIRFRDDDFLTGRIGARLAKTWALDENVPQPRLITGWLRANLWHEFLGDSKTEFSSQIGFVPFRADLGGTWGGTRCRRQRPDHPLRLTLRQRQLPDVLRRRSPCL